MKCMNPECGGEILQTREVTVVMRVKVPLVKENGNIPNKADVADAVNDQHPQVMAHNVIRQVSKGMYCSKCGRGYGLANREAPGKPITQGQEVTG